MISFKKERKKREAIRINEDDFKLLSQSKDEQIDFSNELDKTDEPLQK